MRGFEHPIPLVSPTSLVLAQQFLLWLYSQGGGGSTDSIDLEGVIHTQFEGSTRSNTSASVNAINDFIHSLNSLTHSASWHGLPGSVGLASLAQYCRALAYAKSFVVISGGNPGSQTMCPSMGERHPSPGNVGQVAPYNH